MKKVLFICTHNAARSQMAEGLLKSMYGETYEVYSAGIKPTKVNPFAIKAMAEIDVDISSYSSKSVEDVKNTNFDLGITLCDSAKEDCPIFLNAKRQLHKGFPDPTSKRGSNKKVLAEFTKVRDQIKDYIEEQFGNKNRK